MNLKNAFTTVAFGGTVALVGVGVTRLSQVYNDAVHPASQGQEYLEKKGFRNVSGGETDLLNSCGEGVYARSYRATSPSGKTGDYTVCFNLFGPSRPLF